MPLTPATTDKFTHVGLPGTATSLSSPGYTIGNGSITVASTTDWPTDTGVFFAMDIAEVVAGKTQRVAGTYCEFFGIVTSGTVISNLVLIEGTAQNYTPGSLSRVYIPVASSRENALVDGLNVDHNGKGNHKTLTDDNNNEWLGRNQVASAVNYVQVSNSVAGSPARTDGAGGDSVVDYYMGGKGTGGIAHVENPEIYQANFVASGGIVAQTSGLTGSFSNIIYYIAGKRYKKSGVANRAYTATKDTYVDIDITGTVSYTAVTVGATSPALAANSIRLAVVNTNGSAIAGVNQYGVDIVTTSGQVNYIYNTSPTAAPMFVNTNSGSAGGSYYYRNQNGEKELWGNTASIPSGSLANGTGFAVNFPSGFFHVTTEAGCNFINLVSTAQQEVHWNPVAATGGTLTVGNNVTPVGNETIAFHVRGW